MKKYIKYTILLCIVLFAFYTPLKIQHYKISIKPPLKEPISIALIADTHSSTMYYKSIIKNLLEMQPDVIMLGGDIIDDKTPMQKGIDFIQYLKKELPHIPIYFVSGNHEFHGLGIKRHKEIIQSLGVIVVGTQAPYEKPQVEILKIKDSTMLIAGLDDPSITYYDPYGKKMPNKEDKQSVQWKQEYLDPIRSMKEKADIKILLTHRPEFAEYYKGLPFDMILTGHAHGGQIRIPFILDDGLYAPNQGFFPKYTNGVHEIQPQQFLVISRGINFDITRPRIFNPVEIVEIVVQ